MSSILDMIKNEKVEWKKLGEVCEIVRGVRVTKKELIENGNYPVVSGGVGYMGYINDYNRDEDTITIAQYGTAGYVKWQEEKFWANDVCFSVYPNDKINKRYLYHFLLEKQNYLYAISNKIAVPYSISKNKILNIKIPVPQIKTQEKIVEILDIFAKYSTELQAELQAELQNRSRQYEYFRDLLLSEDYLNKLSQNPRINTFKLRKTTLGEIGKFTRGNGLQKRDFITKGKPVIHYGQIFTEFGFQTDKTYSFVSEEIYNKLQKAKKNDVLIATTSENIEDVGKSLVWLGDEDIGFSGDMYSYRTSENSKYIAYFLQSYKFQKQKKMMVSGTKVIRLHENQLSKLKLFIPPLTIQNKVVEVLDKFQDLIADAEGLLPEEIAQRQKQYEYYREKLLTFDQEVVQGKARQGK